MTQDRPDLKVRPGASLRSLAIDAIRREISEGRMAPGSRLIERDLCDALGVSRTVVREAVRHLEAEGYVSSAPRAGPIVAPLDPDTVRSIYEVRGALEARAAALFVERAGDEDREAVTATFERLEACERRGEHVELLTILKELGHVINKGSRNALFDPILAPLNGRVHMLQVRAALSPKRRPAALRELRALAKALVADDPDAAADAAAIRLNNAGAFALETLSQEGRTRRVPAIDS